MACFLKGSALYTSSSSQRSGLQPDAYDPFLCTYPSMAGPEGRLTPSDLHRAVNDGDVSAVKRMFERLVREQSEPKPLSAEELERIVLADNGHGRTALDNASSADAATAYMQGVHTLAASKHLSAAALMRILAHLPPGSGMNRSSTLAGLAVNRSAGAALDVVLASIRSLREADLIGKDDVRRLLCREEDGVWLTALDQALEEGGKNLELMLRACIDAAKNDELTFQDIAEGLGFHREGWIERQVHYAGKHETDFHPLGVAVRYGYIEPLTTVLDAFDQMYVNKKATRQDIEPLLSPLLTWQTQGLRGEQCKELLRNRLDSWK